MPVYNEGSSAVKEGRAEQSRLSERQMARQLGQSLKPQSTLGPYRQARTTTAQRGAQRPLTEREMAASIRGTPAKPGGSLRSQLPAKSNALGKERGPVNTVRPELNRAPRSTFVNPKNVKLV
jgi:hypothetical protein